MIDSAVLSKINAAAIAPFMMHSDRLSDFLNARHGHCRDTDHQNIFKGDSGMFLRRPMCGSAQCWPFLAL
ncbi:MAG: hypothetical protein ABIO64_09715 [Burkholderiaceae bacterium]